MPSQINGSASRFLVVHTELQVHYPEIAVSPAESGGIRPSGGIRRIPADSAGNWLSYSTVNHLIAEYLPILEFEETCVFVVEKMLP